MKLFYKQIKWWWWLARGRGYC